MIKIFECKICKELAEKNLKGQKRFRGTRQEVRKHLVEFHNKKGNRGGSNKGYDKKDLSEITKNTLSEELK